MKYLNKTATKSYKKNNKFFMKKIFWFFLIILIFFTGILTERFDLKLQIKSFTSELIDTTANRIYSAFSNKKAKLIIDINYKNYMEILSSRDKSIKSQRASEDIHDWVAAKMTLNNKSYKIKIKLKGVHNEHWIHPNKWSFKIKLANDQSINGIKRFSIQQPKTRDFLYEWLFMKTLEKEKLIAHRTKYLETIVNGNNLGVYFFEEQHSKQLIENNKRREGPIIGLDKNLWINEVNNRNDLTVNVLEDTFWRAKIKAVQFKDDKIGTVQEIYLKNAIKLFEDFRSDKVKLDEVFDVKQLATLMAVKAIFGTIEFDWRDIKFYYNPITSLLEPIGREVHISQNFNSTNAWWIDSSPSGFLHSLDQKDFVNLLYNNQSFYKLYLSELYRLSEDNYLKKIIEINKKEFDDYKRLLEINFPTEKIFSEQHLDETRKIIRKTLNPIQGINAYFVDYKEDHILLSIQNAQRLPIELKGIKFIDGKELLLKNSIVINGKKHNKPMESFLLKLPCSNNLNSNDINSIKLLPIKNCQIYLTDDNRKFISESNKVIFRILGQNTIKEASISRFYRAEGVKIKKTSQINSLNLKNLPYFKIDYKNKEINFNQERIIINKKLIIPEGFIVNFSQGTEIILSDLGQIISYSPINMIGTKDNPIIFRSNFQGSVREYRNYFKDDSRNYGYGLSVINAKSKSHIEHTVFKRLAAPSLNTGEGFLGAINFYRSDVNIENSEFYENLRGDDYLNIISSNFLIKYVKMQNINYDAIDFDFSNGSIEDISIIDTNNDALDFSGSKVEAINIFIDNVRDKGISAGEESTIDIKNIKLNNANIAVASKDLSKLNIKGIEIKNSNIAVAAFQKKPEFGPGYIVIEDIIIKDTLKKYVSEQNSVIKINNKNIEASDNSSIEFLSKFLK